MRRARYSDEAVAERIDRARKQLGLTNKELAGKVGILEASWSRKMRGQGNTFTLTEIAAVADALEAPAGWPFVDWEYAEAMQRTAE
jgi:transcriptional regulator with XRE-family HTH domain